MSPLSAYLPGHLPEVFVSSLHLFLFSPDFTLLLSPLVFLPFAVCALCPHPPLLFSHLQFPQPRPQSLSCLSEFHHCFPHLTVRTLLPLGPWPFFLPPLGYLQLNSVLSFSQSYVISSSSFTPQASVSHLYLVTLSYDLHLGPFPFPHPSPHQSLPTLPSC